MQFLICNKWKIDVLDGKNGGHYKWLNKNSKVIGHNALCQEWLLSECGHGMRVLEPFGGLGVASIIIRNLLTPSWQKVYEIDKDCLQQLNHCLGQLGIEVAYGDAKETVVKNKADVYIMDFASYTCYRHGEWEEQWKAIFSSKPKIVVWFDSSARYLHINKDRYSKVLDSVVSSKEDYVKAVSEFTYDRYGYSITKATYEPTAYMAYFLALPISPGNIEVFIPPKESVGLRIC
jgi:hypothetical protein